MAFNLQSHTELTNLQTTEDVSLGIMRWGTSNSFPQTLKNLITQSPTAKPVIDRTAKFLMGGSFEGEDIIVSPYGLTLKKVVSNLAMSYAIHEAFSMQMNYNIKGIVAGINPMDIAEERFNRFDELNYSSKIGYHQDFGRNAVERKLIANIPNKGDIKWFNRFNPSEVLAQMEKEGFDNYLGQILYHTEVGHSSYPIPPLQSVINYVLADIENSILMRKESSTGFISSYILKTTLDSEDPNLIALETAIESAQGARGAGKVITFSGMSPEDLQATVLEEIGTGSAGAKGVVDAATAADELISKKIIGAYLIPPILAGTEVSTGFSTQALKDAYFVFNSITQVGRDTIESEINRVLKNSVFDIKEIKLNKLTLDEDEMEDKDV